MHMAVDERCEPDALVACPTDVIYEYLKKNGCLRDTSGIAFMGCGDARQELALLRRIDEGDHDVRTVVLMDTHATKATLEAACSMASDRRRATLLSDFGQLRRKLDASEGGWLVLGINSGLRITQAREREFAELCRMCASEPRVPCDWLNFLILGAGWRDVPYDLLDEGSGTYIHRCAWELMGAGSL